MEISDLSGRNVKKKTVIKMLMKLRRIINEQSENFRKEIENIKNYKLKSQS